VIAGLGPAMARHRSARGDAQAIRQRIGLHPRVDSRGDPLGGVARRTDRPRGQIAQGAEGDSAAEHAIAPNATNAAAKASKAARNGLTIHDPLGRATSPGMSLDGEPAPGREFVLFAPRP
jgi:hypothetical protein